jgi:hypothetical protein
MLAKECVQIALGGGKPERVPVYIECDYDYIAKAAGKEPWEFVHGDLPERAQILEAHFIRHRSDLWLCWGAPSKRRLERRRVIRNPDGVFYLDTRTGRKCRIDRRGDLFAENGEPVSLSLDGELCFGVDTRQWLTSRGYPRPVETEDDIVELLGPVPSLEHWVDDGFLSSLEYLLPRHGQTHFVAFPLNTIFANVLDLFGGFQEGLIAMKKKSRLFHKALEAIVERKISRLRAGVALGAPGAMMIEYTAGADIISPAAYREFVFPYEQAVAQEAHRLGIQVYLWFLGDVMPLLPQIGQLEIDGLFPEQGRKGYDVDIVEMRRQLGDRICLVGFNNERDLINGHFGALEREIERQIQGAGLSGAFIMGTTIVTEDAPLEHVARYLDTVRRLGAYSLLPTGR